MDITGPLVTTFEELSKEEPDADLTCAAAQHALLLLGNISAHLSHMRHMKILKCLNKDIHGLAKDADFSKVAPCLFGEGIEQKIKERVEAVRVLRPTTAEFKLKQFFKEAPLKKAASGGADINRNPGTTHTNTNTIEVPVQVGPSRKPPADGEDNEHNYRSPKGDIVSVIAKECANVLHAWSS